MELYHCEGNVNPISKVVGLFKIIMHVIIIACYDYQLSNYKPI